jgi:hypothetical protein
MIALQAGGGADISWLYGSISAGGWRALAIDSLFAAEIQANRSNHLRLQCAQSGVGRVGSDTKKRSDGKSCGLRLRSAKRTILAQL